MRFLFPVFGRCKESLDNFDQTNPAEQGHLRDARSPLLLIRLDCLPPFVVKSSCKGGAASSAGASPAAKGHLGTRVLPHPVPSLLPGWTSLQGGSPSPNQQGFPFPSSCICVVSEQLFLCWEQLREPLFDWLLLPLLCVPDVTLVRLKAFIPQLLSRLHIEALLHGNITKKVSRWVSPHPRLPVLCPSTHSRCCASSGFCSAEEL